MIKKEMKKSFCCLNKSTLFAMERFPIFLINQYSTDKPNFFFCVHVWLLIGWPHILTLGCISNSFPSATKICFSRFQVYATTNPT